jgi:hypothetical protein
MDERDVAAYERAFADALFLVSAVADPSRFMNAEKLESFFLPALRHGAPESVEKRKTDFEKHLRDILRHVANEKIGVKYSIFVPLLSMLRGANLGGRYDGMQAGYALHKYGRWLDRQLWLKKVMRVMRDYPDISPERMCRELDRRYKQTVRTGKHREEKATPEAWSNLSWIQELLMNRTNVDVLRSKAKKQLESENFKLLSAWYRLNGKDPLSKREPDDHKEFD